MVWFHDDFFLRFSVSHFEIIIIKQIFKGVNWPIEHEDETILFSSRILFPTLASTKST